jgi:hypothetical protein
LWEAANAGRIERMPGKQSDVNLIEAILHALGRKKIADYGIIR